MFVGTNYLKLNSSFMNVEKDLGYIVQKLIKDDVLVNLLLLKDMNTAVTAAERKQVLKENIKIVPKLEGMNTSDKSYIVIVFDNFMNNATNPEYRDKMLTFDIICNFDTWQMNDFKLRPYLIAGHIDSAFNKKSLDGTYTLNFMALNNLIIDQSIAGVTLTYAVTYGEAADKLDNE